MKVAALVALVASALFCQGAVAQARTGTYSQKTLLKNWALSRCLATVYPDDDVKRDANATASAYLEYGHQPAAAYQQVDTLVRQFAQKKYTGSVDSPFNTMKCIDLLHSRQLEELVDKLVK